MAMAVAFLPNISCRSELYCNYDYPFDHCLRSPFLMSSVCINHMSESRSNSHSQMDKCHGRELHMDRDRGIQFWDRSSKPGKVCARFPDKGMTCMLISAVLSNSYACNGR